jgi:hypothetical protein
MEKVFDILAWKVRLLRFVNCFFLNLCFQYSSMLDCCQSNFLWSLMELGFWFEFCLNQAALSYV